MGDYLIPTAKGIALISALPEVLKSPSLTAQWERKLCLVEAGKLSESEFMSEIETFIKTVVAENNTPKPEVFALLGNHNGDNTSIGVCPRCNSPIREGKSGFFCDSRSCGFKMWKDIKFWTAKKKPLTADIAATLLKERRVYVKGFHSPKTGKTYDATVTLIDTGEYINFGLEFDKK